MLHPSKRAVKPGLLLLFPSESFDHGDNEMLGRRIPGQAAVPVGRVEIGSDSRLPRQSDTAVTALQRQFLKSSTARAR
jgi:hypothetical protein